MSSLPILEALYHPAIGTLFDYTKNEILKIDPKIDFVSKLQDEALECPKKAENGRFYRINKALALLFRTQRKIVLNSLCRGPSSPEVLSNMPLEMDGELLAKTSENVVTADRFLSCFAKEELLSRLHVAITDEMDGNKRSCFDGNAGKIRLNDNEIGTLLHEMGHAIDFCNPRVAARCKEFLEERTRGKPLHRLRDLCRNPGYEEYEFASPDDFMKPYVGKLYDGNSTEILSMGIGFLFDNPLEFLQFDEEHLRFVIAVLRGVL